MGTRQPAAAARSRADPVHLWQQFSNRGAALPGGMDRGAIAVSWVFVW